MKGCTLRRYARVAVLVSLCIGIQLPYSRAQVSSSGVNGVVSDTSGAVVPNAKVRITLWRIGHGSIMQSSEALSGVEVLGSLFACRSSGTS